MQAVADKLKELRHKTGISQLKMAEALGLKQGAINRYENNQSDPTSETLFKYAEFFDVSLDYIFGRTDNPEGTSFECKPKMEMSHPELKEFIEMCFDPKSPMNDRLKETLFELLDNEIKS